MDGHKTAYENAACDVLAALYFDNAKIALCEYEHGLKPVLFPTPEHGLLFKTLCDLSRAGELVNDNTILSKIGSSVNAEWLTDVLHVYTPQVGQAFESNCKLVLKYGLRASASRVVKIMGEQFDDVNGKPLEHIVSQGTDILTGLNTGNRAKAVQADEISAELDADFDAPEEKTIPTGLAWLDGLSSGFAPGDIWMIAGAYKMRKTTLMINMCLNIALNGISTTFLSREMSRKQVAAQMIAMLAVGDLFEHGEYDCKFKDHNGDDGYLNWIAPRKLLQVRSGYRSWDKRKVRAIDAARVKFRALEKVMRIYDTTPDNGGLSDIASAQNAVKRDLFLYSTQVVFVDYLQLFNAPVTGTFEQAAYNSRSFQEMGKRDAITMVIAAQRNEEAIKSTEESYSPGIKGGGDAAAVADFALQTRYKVGTISDETKLEIAITLSRHGSGGSDTKYTANIHPNSGLLLDSNYALKCKRKYQLEFGRQPL